MEIGYGKMDWKKRFRKPEPGDKIKVIKFIEGTEKPDDFEVGDILTIERLDIKHGNHGKEWKVEGSNESIYEGEFVLI